MKVRSLIVSNLAKGKQQKLEGEIKEGNSGKSSMIKWYFIMV